MVLRNDLENYAMKVLADNGCDCYTYGGEWSKKIMDDLKEEYPKGMRYPYIDVANAILRLSRPEPIVKDPYLMVWDNGSDMGEVGYESFQAAKSAAEDTLCEWGADEMSRWKSDIPTEDEKDNWNYMYYNCSVCVDRYIPETDEYQAVWAPNDKELIELGWKELV